MGLTIDDNTKEFIRKSENVLDVILNTAAVDIERLAKVKAPFFQGPLRSSISHFRRGELKYAVIANKEYAAYQEYGARKGGSHVVRKYSKSGTGKGYLRSSGIKIGKDLGRRLEAAQKLLR